VASDEDDTRTSTTSSSFVPTATATGDCKAIGELLLAEAVAESEDEPLAELEKKTARDTLHSRRIEKRKPKSGVACVGHGVQLTSGSNYHMSGKVGFVGLNGSIYTGLVD